MEASELTVPDYLYDRLMELMEIPRSIYEIFCDFYGEDKVDLQEKFPYIEFWNNIATDNIWDFISADARVHRPELVGRTFGSLDILELIEDTVLTDIITQALLRKGFILRILVHFPVVTVTNEYNKSTVITNLYVRCDITASGKMKEKFQMNRSEYTLAEWKSDYMHSHIPGIPGNPEHFLLPCLGSGPLVNTVDILLRQYDRDRWGLFCLELQKFVETESLQGTPYRRLENISLQSLGTSLNYTATCNMNPLVSLGFGIKYFIPYYLKHNKFKIGYVNGEYVPGISYKEYLLDITDSFISWCNSEGKGVISDIDFFLHKVKIIGNTLFYDSTIQTESGRVNHYEGNFLFYFKGNPVIFHIRETENLFDNNSILVLTPEVANRIVYTILNLINLKYGKKFVPATGRTRYL